MFVLMNAVFSLPFWLTHLAVGFNASIEMCYVTTLQVSRFFYAAAYRGRRSLNAVLCLGSDCEG